MIQRSLDAGRRAGHALIYRAPREREECPACGGSRLSVLGVHKLQQAIDGRRTGLISGCHGCGLVFVNPPPTDAVLTEMYGPSGEWGTGRVADDASQKVEPGKPGRGSWTHLFDPVRAEFDVTRPAAGARVLDFGCGSGKFLNVLQDCGWQTFGIEPALDAAFQRHQRLTQIPREPQFDLVIVHHVLEHVVDPLALLRQLAASANTGGLLLVAGPRLDTLPLHRDYEYVISRVHVTAYTSLCMQGLLARAGWQVVAPPADDVAIAGGRRTAARLRLLARRIYGELPLPAQPLEPARKALAAYYDEGAGRPLLQRAGLMRLSARVIESRRRLRKLPGIRRVRPHAAR